jgi:hypothetical protein
MRVVCSFLILSVFFAFPVPFKKDDKWGYRDSRGNAVISPRFEVAHEFSAEGIAGVVDSQGWAYIDPTGRVVVRPVVVDNGPDYFVEGLARFRAGGKIGFFDKKGKVVIQANYAFARPFSEGLAAVCDSCKEVRQGEHTAVMGGKWGFINPRGVVVIPLQFEDAGSFETGRARVKTTGSWKYIDKHGAFVGTSGSDKRFWGETSRRRGRVSEFQNPSPE